MIFQEILTGAASSVTAMATRKTVAMIVILRILSFGIVWFKRR